MPKGRPEHARGRRRHTRQVAGYAGQLAALRVDLDGMRSTDPGFAVTLAAAALVAADLDGASLRMDRDGDSRRNACTRLAAQAIQRVSPDMPWPDYAGARNELLISV
ncbi:MAG TPA: hypothetical protein VLE99_01905 [Candidatus Saccharimonadales bacterium]|nr:hypothetical protein [Candidatus Saccharimonadales bacterium]